MAKLLRNDRRIGVVNAGEPKAALEGMLRRDGRGTTSARRWLDPGRSIAAGLLIFAFGVLFATVVELDNPISFAQSPQPRPVAPRAMQTQPPPAPSPTAPPSPSVAQPVTPAAAPPAEQPFVNHIRQAGIRTCGTVYPALGQLLTEGSQFMVQSSWHQGAPDAHAVQALVGMRYGTLAAAGIVFASPSGNRCDGNLVRVVPFAEDCNTATGKLPQGSTYVANLSGIPVYNLPGTGGQAMLLAAGTGCIALSVLRVERPTE